MKWLFSLLLLVNLILAAVILSNRSAPPAMPPADSGAIKLLRELPPVAEVAAPKIKAACFQFGPVPESDTASVDAALAKLDLGDKLIRQSSADTSSFWVYIPPAKSKTEAEKRIKELNLLGITDHFLIQEGKWRHAISLGIFKSADAAKRLAASLQAKGAKAAVSGPRDSTPKEMTYSFNGLDDDASQKIGGFAKAFPKIELKQLECDAAP